MLFKLFLVKIFEKNILTIFACYQHWQSTNLTTNKGQLLLNAITTLEKLAQLGQSQLELAVSQTNFIRLLAAYQLNIVFNVFVNFLFIERHPQNSLF